MGKKTFILIVLIGGIITTVIGGMVVYGTREVMEMEISDIDLSRVPDGIYKGQQKYMGFICKVTVEVKNHRIVNIDVFEARGGEYVEKAKQVTLNVLQKQSLDVDTITGATVTSKAILKAIENALKPAG